MKLSALLPKLVASTLVVLIQLGCGEATTYIGEAPPTGVGAFNPGTNGNGNGYGAYGAGANSGTGGGGGQGGSGPPQCDEELRRCLHTFSYPSQGTEQSVEVRGDFAADGWTNGEPMTLSGSLWSAEVYLPWDTDVQYKFVIDGTAWVTDPNNPDTIADGQGGYNSLLAGITCEDWICVPPVVGDFDWRDAVLYFVFVDRFNDGDPSNNGSPVASVETPANYQGGDWAGVLAKIDDDYFTDLGINTLWLSVPMDNPDQAGMGNDQHMHSAYHGYWPSDLETTESRFGSQPELIAQVEAAHAKDIKVIVDYAMNHVHISSSVYTQHNDWFWPLYDGSKYCVCGADCGWDGADGKRCWFTDYLPDFNFNVAAARDYSVDNAIWWIQQSGIDGFRLDAVKHIEDSWITDLRSRVTAEIESVTEQHFYMVGETFTGDKDTIKYYVNPTTMLDGQFDFPFRAALISAVMARSSSMNDLDSFLASNDGFYGAGIMSTFIGNHDVPRSIHFAQDNPEWGDVWSNGKDKAWSGQPQLPAGASAFERFAAAYTVLFTLPGVPLIYYGDEIGLPGAGDPDNRRFMQWTGYNTHQTNLRDHVTALTQIRADHSALRRGSRTTLSVSNDTIAYKMKDGSDEVFVLVNRGDNSATVGGLPSGNYTDLLTTNTHSGPNISVSARSSRVLITQ